MNQHLLKAASKWIFPIFLFMGIFLLFRGHNEPGGGFIGGLIFGAAFVIRYITNPINPSLYRLGFWRPTQVTAFGLFIAGTSGLVSAVAGLPYMTGVWHFEVWLPLVGNTKFGTPFYFDIGVFFVVVGVVAQIFLSLEEQKWKSS